jgi:hypothetical protein
MMACSHNKLERVEEHDYVEGHGYLYRCVFCGAKCWVKGFGEES